MSVNKKKNIFISYRVRDTQAATGRLVDALKQHFDSDQIFMDIDKIEPGLDFTEVISKSLDNCDVMLAMIGPDWMAYDAEKKTYRINNENDWVRQEIATALRRNIRVVPVLLEGATLPEDADLPEDLKPLLRRQSYEITNKRWQYDSGELIDFLQKLFGVSPKPETPSSTVAAVSAPKKSYTKYWLIAGAALLLMIIIQMCNPNEELINPNPNPVLPLPSPERISYSDITGTWQDPVGQGRFIIAQENGKLRMAAYGVNDEQTGNGSGVIIGNKVTIDAQLFFSGNTIPVQYNLELSNDEQTLTGNIVVENAGATYSEKTRLEKL